MNAIVYTQYGSPAVLELRECYQRGITMIYQIRLQGHLGQQWAEWFAGLTITLTENGDTLLTGPVVDQAALHGLLRKVRDLGIPLVSVIQVDPGPTDA